MKRRADVGGIFPNEASILRLIGAVLLEANDEWPLQHRYISLELFNDLTSVLDDDPPLLALSVDPGKLPHAAA